MISLTLRTPLIEFRSALALRGFRTREEYDELVHASPDCEVRVMLREQSKGQLVRCFVSVAEDRLLLGGLELFNEMSLEGHPAVAYGAGRGQMTFEFEWFHAAGVDWRASAVRVDSVLQRVSSVLGPRPAPARANARRRIREGVTAMPSFAPGIFAAA